MIGKSDGRHGLSRFRYLARMAGRLNRADEFLVGQTVADPIFESGDSSHLDLAGVFFGLGEIIFHLESKPHVGLAAESFR